MQSGSYKPGWLKKGAFVVFTLALVGLAIARGLKTSNDISSAKSLVTVFINTNGHPSVMGVPLGNRFLRQAFFHSLKRTGVRVGIQIPISICTMSPVASSNALQVLGELSSATLLRPPPPSGQSAPQ